MLLFRPVGFRELWVPAAELADFNAEIVGVIRVVESVYGPGFAAELDAASGLPASVVAAFESREV